MFSFVFAQFALSGDIYYKSLNPDNFEHEALGPIPTVVRFFSSHRKYSLDLDEQYDFVSLMYEGIEGIKIAAVNCGKFRSFCYKMGVAQPPDVRLYKQNVTYIYDGGMSHESISRWATGITGVHPKELPFALKKPNGRVFKELINNTHCVFAMFFNPKHNSEGGFLNEMRKVADAFRYDDRVEICAIDCDLYKFFNWDYDLSIFPCCRLWCKDESEQIGFEGHKTAEDLIDFINDYCGTMRGLDGRLHSEAGVIEEVSPIVEDFLTKGRRPQYIADMEQTEGTKYYVTVMKEVTEKGVAWITDERERLNRLLDSKTLSPDKLDEFQIRVNILNIFAQYIDEDSI
jgi:protein disulfide-isomerase A6